MKPTPRTRTLERENAELRDLLTDILHYRRGIGKYNLSLLSPEARSIAALEAWEEIENRIEQALNPAGSPAEKETL